MEVTGANCASTQFWLNLNQTLQLVDKADNIWWPIMHINQNQDKKLLIKTKQT